MRDYWIPMIAFGALTLGETFVSPELYPAAYIAKAVIVTTILLFCRTPLREITFDSRVILPSILIGLLVFVAWVGLDLVIDYPRLGGRVGFNPERLLGSSWWLAFMLFVSTGCVLMVPVMEEIFWRSFLLRYLTRHDFRALPDRHVLCNGAVGHGGSLSRGAPGMARGHCREPGLRALAETKPQLVRRDFGPCDDQRRPRKLRSRDSSVAVLVTT